jgi:hypothetical protein
LNEMNRDEAGDGTIVSDPVRDQLSIKAGV